MRSVKRGIALWLVFLWMSPTLAFSDGPTSSLEKEKAALLEMIAFVSDLQGSQLPALRAVRDKAEEVVERLREEGKRDPSKKKEAGLIDEKILKPIDGLIDMGRLLEACGGEPLLSGLGRQFVRAMVERLNIGECRDLQAIAIQPEIITLARNVSQIEKAIATGGQRPKKVDDSELFEKIWQKSREMAIVSYFKEYSKLQGQIHFDPLNITQQTAQAYFKITGKKIDESVVDGQPIFFLPPEDKGIWSALWQIRKVRGEEFKQSQKSSYEEFVKENREAYRKEVEEALQEISQVKERLQEDEEKVRLFKQLHNARFIIPPDKLTARYEGPRLIRRGPYGGFFKFDEIEAPKTETGRYDAYDGVITLPENPLDVDYVLRGQMAPPRMMFPPSADVRLEEGERLFLTYLDREKKIGSDFSRARDLGYYAEPPIENPKERFKSFFNTAFGPEAFSQLENYLDSALKPIRERSKSERVYLDKDALAQVFQEGLAQVSAVDESGRRVPALIDARERLAQSRARYEVLKNEIYRNFVVVRHNPEIQKMWENDEAKPISSDSVSDAWQSYDLSMQEFLKKTLPRLKADGAGDPKKQIKLALKFHPSAILETLLDDPRKEVAKRICELGNEIKVDEMEAEEDRLIWGLGATLAVGASAVLTYGMGPLFGYGLGFGAYGDAIFAGTATAIGGGHMLGSSIPDYRALAFEGEVMEDILLALGEGDPRAVKDKMGEINAHLAALIGEGAFNAAGALAFFNAARHVPAGLRAEMIRKELEAVKRLREAGRRIAVENVQKGRLARDLDVPVFNEKRVYDLSEEERIAYAEGALNFEPGSIANNPISRQAILYALYSNDPALGEELMSRGQSLENFWPDEIRRMVIAGKARRLRPVGPDRQRVRPFTPAEEREILEMGIAGDEAFLKGTPKGEVENTLAGLEKGVPETSMGPPTRPTWAAPSQFYIEVPKRGIIRGLVGRFTGKKSLEKMWFDPEKRYRITLKDGSTQDGYLVPNDVLNDPKFIGLRKTKPELIPDTGGSYRFKKEVIEPTEIPHQFKLNGWDFNADDVLKIEPVGSLLPAQGELSNIAVGKSYEVKLKGGEIFRGHLVKKVPTTDGQTVYMFEEAADGQIRSADEIRSLMPPQIEEITEAKVTAASPRSVVPETPLDLSLDSPMVPDKPKIGEAPAFQPGDTIHFVSRKGNEHRVTFKGYRKNGLEVILPGEDKPRFLPRENIKEITKVEKPTTR